AEGRASGRADERFLETLLQERLQLAAVTGGETIDPLEAGKGIISIGLDGMTVGTAEAFADLVIPGLEQVRGKRDEGGARLRRPERILARVVRVQDGTKSLQLPDAHARIGGHRHQWVEAMGAPILGIWSEAEDGLAGTGTVAAGVLEQLTLEIHADDGVLVGE